MESPEHQPEQTHPPPSPSTAKQKTSSSAYPSPELAYARNTQAATLRFTKVHPDPQQPLSSPKPQTKNAASPQAPAAFSSALPEPRHSYLQFTVAGAGGEVSTAVSG